MNCDQVFHVLTRGPFPSGAKEDVLVDEHLNHCISCWRIAEALRPNQEVLQESLAPTETRDLPSYWGDTTPPGACCAELSEKFLGPPQTLRTDGPHSGRLLHGPLATLTMAESPATQTSIPVAKPDYGWVGVLFFASAIAVVGGLVASYVWPFG